MKWPTTIEPDPESCKDQKQASAKAIEQFGKYVKIAKMGKETQVFFEVGCQGFFIGHSSDEPDLAEFLRIMLCDSLRELEEQRKPI